MTQVPAGWYDTPDGVRRYWDGTKWTDAVAPAAPTASAPAPAQPLAAPAAPATPATPATPADRARAGRMWRWALTIAIVVAIAGLAGAVAAIQAQRQHRPELDADQVIAAFVLAAESVDCGSFDAVTTERYREEAGVLTCEDLGTLSVRYFYVPRTYAVTSTSEDGGTATVDVNASGIPSRFTLVREDGVWRVDAWTLRPDGDMPDSPHA